jgi:hypothetical protein
LLKHGFHHGSSLLLLWNGEVRFLSSLKLPSAPNPFVTFINKSF